MRRQLTRLLTYCENTKNFSNEFFIDEGNNRRLGQDEDPTETES
jgi:hypothetical protein